MMVWRNQASVHRGKEGTLCREHRRAGGERLYAKGLILSAEFSSGVGGFAGVLQQSGSCLLHVAGMRQMSGVLLPSTE